MRAMQALTNTPLLQHVDEFQLAGKSCLLAPQSKPGHVAQVLCLSGACSAHIQHPGFGELFLDLNHCLHIHMDMVRTHVS